MELHATMRYVIGAATWLGCVPAFADNSIRLEIRLSDAVLTPGEVQHIEVWAHTDPVAGTSFFHPSYGQQTSLGFGGSLFDLVNTKAGETGEFSGILQSNPWLAHFEHGNPEHGGVIGIVTVGHACLFGSNPNVLLLWSADWLPFDYGPREVTWTTLTTKSAIATLHDFCFLPWPSEDSHASFKVVPAPGAMGVLALGAAGLARRRR